MHGVELSIGSALHWNAGYLDILDRFQAIWPFHGHSEHLSYQTIPGDDQRPLSIDVPLPLPGTAEVVQPEPDFDDQKGRVYRAPSQAGLGNDIHAGSPGFQKAPTRGPIARIVCSRSNSRITLSRLAPARIAAHDLHHRYADCNFAVVDNFWDWLLGSYRGIDADREAQPVLVTESDIATGL